MDKIEEAEIVEYSLESAQKAIDKGEKTKLLYELFMEQLGCTYKNTFQEVVIKMKEAQDAYNEGVKYIENVIKTAPKR